LLVAHHSILVAGSPAPTVGLKVSHFLSIWQGFAGPRPESTQKNHTAVMCAEAKFSKINQPTKFKELSGRGDGGTPGG
jgi:hypothetical protein